MDNPAMSHWFANSSNDTQSTSMPGHSRYYYGLRHYSPSTGRWISRDPIEEPRSLALYVFAENGVVDRVDPFGLQWLMPPYPPMVIGVLPWDNPDRCACRITWDCKLSGVSWEGFMPPVRWVRSANMMWVWTVDFDAEFDCEVTAIEGENSGFIVGDRRTERRPTRASGGMNAIPPGGLPIRLEDYVAPSEYRRVETRRCGSLST